MSQPPIIPGRPSAEPLAAEPPVTAAAAVPPRRPRRWLVPALATVAAVAIAAAVFFAVGGLDRLRAAVGDPVAATSPLRQASLNCGETGQLADNDRTLILDVGGEAANSGLVGQTTLACVLRELKVPAYVLEQIGNTRALDGQMKATWDGLEASWTYHPDEGLNLVIHQT